MAAKLGTSTKAGVGHAGADRRATVAAGGAGLANQETSRATRRSATGPTYPCGSARHAPEVQRKRRASTALRRFARRGTQRHLRWCRVVVVVEATGRCITRGVGLSPSKLSRRRSLRVDGTSALPIDYLPGRSGWDREIAGLQVGVADRAHGVGKECSGAAIAS